MRGRDVASELVCHLDRQVWLIPIQSGLSEAAEGLSRVLTRATAVVEEMRSMSRGLSWRARL